MTENKEVYYSDYLQLDKILDAQHPESAKLNVEAHDEMLFIVIHQSYELWFKQILYELRSIIGIFNAPVVDDNEASMQTVVHRANRIIAILRILVDKINVMETMTSLDFLDFRDLLRPASGFQSVQWKELEALLGLRFQDRHGKHHYTSALKVPDVDRVKHTEDEDSLLALVSKWLERMPYLNDEAYWGSPVDRPEDHPFWKEYRGSYEESLLEIERGNIGLFDIVLFGKEAKRDRRLSPAASRSALFIMLYRGFPLLHMPFQLLMSLLEIDELMASWRTRHMNMVHRMIGARVGTGNSSGRNYLKAALDKHYIYHEVAELNGLLLPRHSLPQLPAKLIHKLGFSGVNDVPA